MRLALDPLSAGLLFPFIVGVSCSIAAGFERRRLFALCVPPAATLLILLAADAGTVIVGVAVIGVTGWLGSHEHVRLQLAATCAAIGCLIAGFAIAGSDDFAALRGVQPESLRLDASAVLLLAGAGALLPWHLWRSAAADGLSALVAACAFIVSFYLATRVLFDLFGAAQLSWFGVGLLMVGAAVALSGSLRAAVVTEFDAVVLIGSVHQLGLVLVGLGLALIARAVDLPSLLALALDAAWLQFICLVLGRVLLLQCAAMVQAGAGTRRLDLLGGLIQGMPITAGGIFAALFATLALPPSLGFAGFWLLFQALLGLARASGFGLQCLLALVVGCVGLSGALAAFGAVRLCGIGLLGRPRIPRTAAAEDGPRRTTMVMVSLASLLVLLGLVPAAALWPVRSAVARMSGGSAGIVRPLLLSTGEAMPGYAPPVIAVLLLVGAGAVLWLLHRHGPSGRSEPAWSGGFAQPPAWLPFGDPATQVTARSFAEPLRRFADLRAWATLGCLRETMTQMRTLPPVIILLGVLVAVLITWLLAS